MAGGAPGGDKARGGESSSAGRYVYCVAPLVDLAGKSLRGLEGAEVYQIAFQDIGAVVHACPPVPYLGEGEQVKAWLLAHHEVVDAVWEMTGTVLPMSFDVIIKGDTHTSADDNVIHWLQENHSAFRTKLAALKGKVELGIQVVWNRAAAAEQIAAEDPEIRKLQGELRGKPKGVAFFYQQLTEKRVKNKLDETADAICATYLKEIQALTCETLSNKPRRLDQGEMLLNLSVLADRNRIEDIGMLLGSLQETTGTEVRFTGPWPPYSFVERMPAPDG